MRPKKQKFTMDSAAANNTLQKILSEVQETQNAQAHRSIEKIQEDFKRETRPYRVSAIAAFSFIIVLLIIPLLFHKPAVNVESSGITSLSVFQHHVENDSFYLTLTGGDIDYDHITIIDAYGNEEEVLASDPSTSTIIIPFSDTELNLFIPDKDGNVLHLLLTPKPGK